MKTLYNVDESLNSEGIKFEQDILQAVKPVVARWMSLGFPRVELFHAIFEAIGTEISYKRLVKRYAPRA